MSLGDGWRFNATSVSRPFVVEIRDVKCSDSMSGMPFPHTVSVKIGDAITRVEGESVAGLSIAVRAERMTMSEFRDAFLQPLMKARDTLAERLHAE